MRPPPIRRITTWLVFVVAAIIAALVSSCQSDIAGLTPGQRLSLYKTAAVATGHPEAAIVIDYAARRPVTSAKNPTP